MSKSRAPRRPVNIEPLEARRLLSTVVVNTTADSTNGKGSSTVSLRDAVAIANAATSATTITFSPTVFATAKTITLGGTQLELSNTAEATNITGPSAGLSLSGNGSSRVFLVDAKVNATISDLTITRGNGTTNRGVDGGYGGGGILNYGSTTVTGVTFFANSAAGNGGGGARCINGVLTLIDDTFSGNTAGAGGAVYDGYGGLGTVKMYDSTVAGNSALESGAFPSGFGGGICTESPDATFSIANSIVIGNTCATSGPDAAGDAGGSFGSGNFDSLGHNLIGKTDGSTGWVSSDLTGTIAKPLSSTDLGILTNNGGPTETMLPLTGSPAIDHGSNSLIPTGITTDQRGLPRIYNGAVDIGAVEVQPLIQIKSPGNQTATQGVSKSVTLGSFTQYTNAGPFKDTITWGDGSASTTLSLTAAGTIPATAHVFAKTGTVTVTEIITDAKGYKSNTVTFTETVTAVVGSISGHVFDDTNANGKQDKGEIGLGLWTVYLDLNDDGKLDTGDKSVTTDINGNFSFTGLTAGTYELRIVPVAGDATTTPSGGLIKVVLTAGEISSGNLFGEN